jgi:hypothetical protein
VLSLDPGNRPPLHRPANETRIQRVLYMMSSTDRGQRISHMWAGDKLETMVGLH